MTDEDTRVDEELYSRQLYVLGHEAMKKMMKTKVLIYGMDGLGQEIAKNLCLAGIRSIEIYDNKIVSRRDLCSGYYFTEDDIGRRRDEAVLEKLRRLNAYVNVEIKSKDNVGKNSSNNGSTSESIVDSFYDAVITVNKDTDYNILTNEVCRELKCKFISARVSGLSSQVFVDLLEHMCIDRNGEPLSFGGINDISEDGLLTIADGSKHGLASGDSIRIMSKGASRASQGARDSDRSTSSTVLSSAGSNHASNIYKVDVVSRTELRLRGYSNETRQIGGDFEEVRQPVEIKFRALAEAIGSPQIVSYGNDVVAKCLHNIYSNIVCDSNPLYDKLYKEFRHTEGCLISPMCSIIGGMAAQEVLKAVSGKFMPLQEFFYFTYEMGNDNKDSTDIISKDSIDIISKGITDIISNTTASIDDRYYDLISIIGDAPFKLLQNLNVFLVGAGAIGCENLKNLVMCGVATGQSGETKDCEEGVGAICEEGECSHRRLVEDTCSGAFKSTITVTDMDSIEQSNLNRQFLFRMEDIGAQKSVRAAVRAMELNPAARVMAETAPVGSDTEELFSDKFLSGTDVVLNALDNVEARTYMDGRCVALCRPMIDAGTMGTKGHVQVVIPHITTNYGISTESTESSIPMCTIKSYPNTIEHTIEWALGEFRRIFNEEVEEVIRAEGKVKTGGEGVVSEKSMGAVAHSDMGAHSNVASNSDILANTNTPVLGDLSTHAVAQEDEDKNGISLNTSLPASQSNSLSNSISCEDDDIDSAPRNPQSCIKRALSLFVNLFSTQIQKLLSTFPADSVTKDGIPFWLPPKRPPTPISFNINDKLHILFVDCCANLYAQCYGIRKITNSEVLQYLENVLSLCEPNPIQFDDSVSDPSSFAPLVYDKDSWHADFIYSCANLRARNYKIRERSRHFIKGVSGKIIPAIATTTAVVSGLSVMEILKMVVNMNNGTVAFPYKNTFLDLGMPFLILTDPINPKIQEYPRNNKEDNNNMGDNKEDNNNMGDNKEEDNNTLGVATKESSFSASTVKFTVWDKLELSDRPLKDIISYLSTLYGSPISMCSVGNKIVYWTINNKYSDNLSKTIKEIAGKKKGQIYQFIDVLAEDDIEREAVAILL